MKPNRLYNKIPQKTEGVFYMENINKWLVRVKKVAEVFNGKGVITTIGSFDNKEDAEECFRQAKSGVKF